MTHNNIIFYDHDEVTAGTYNQLIRGYAPGTPDPIIIKALMKACEHLDLKVCVSASMRVHGREYLQQLMEPMGFQMDRLADPWCLQYEDVQYKDIYTLRDQFLSVAPLPEKASPQLRKYEILSYLEKYQDRIGHWVVLDDMDMHFPSQHQIVPRPYDGLSLTDIYTLFSIFGKTRQDFFQAMGELFPPDDQMINACPYFGPRPQQ